MRNRRIRLLTCLFLVLFASSRPIAVLYAEELPGSDSKLEAIFSGDVPEDAADLLAMQQRVQTVSEKVVPTTVSISVGPAQGSGVIITADGYVLTAAHVVGEPKRRATLTLHDGRRVSAETLGVFRTGDAGLVKISRNASDFGYKEWPHVTMGTSAELKAGQWCLATGHPGGFQSKRTPVVRLGRILSVDREKETITTDCTLIGGDSGGPLFDMDGNVIGIHSRIGGSLTLNLHVPVKTYRDSWDRLVASEAWGHAPGSRPFIGVQGDPESESARVARVFDGTPAAEAGIQPGDLIVRFSGKRVTTFESLKDMVESVGPGSKVKLEVERDGRRFVLSLTVGVRQ